MAKLIVSRHGQEVGKFDLQDGQEYVIGRASDCSFVLPEAKGISRQHFKMFQRDGVWMAESLSRFVPLQLDGAAQETIELKRDAAFYAPPYEFQFEATKEAVDPNAGEIVDIGANHKPEAAADNEAAMLEDTVVRGNLEATMAGSSLLVPYLKIRNVDSDEQETLKLEGHLWIAGRGSASEIPLRDARTSRRHFELSRSREGFFLTDLGSSNGTHLNGQRLPPHEPTKVESGDVISVLDIEMMFEIRDVQMANRLQNLPQLYPAMAPQMSMQQLLPPASNLPAEPVETVDWKKWQNWKPENFKKIDVKKINWKKNRVRVALAILAPVLVIAGIFQNSEPDRNVAGKTNDVAFEKMTPDQKNAIKDAFSLARSHYMAGKYELCLTDLATLHQMIPQYEDSKDLEAYCNQGRELVLRQLDIDHREHEKAMLEQTITTVIDNCKEKLKNKGTVEQVRLCLTEAIELNPEHPAIAEMIGAAQARENDSNLLKAMRAARTKETKRGEAMYYKAKSLYVNGKWAKSVRQYQRFIDSSFPGLDNVKEAAKREIASVKKELEKKISSYLEQCKTLSDKSRYKDAYIACDKALAEDPSNDAATQLRGQVLSNLRRDIKSIYEDSVLEESLGNVDSAKEKWKKIVSDDLDFDEYYKKAKILLRKYGVDM